MKAWDVQVEEMQDARLETKDALEIALFMLETIAEGKSFDAITYRNALAQMKQVWALATLENAHTHVIANCDKYTKDYQSFVEVIYNLQAMIQRDM